MITKRSGENRKVLMANDYKIDFLAACFRFRKEIDVWGSVEMRSRVALDKEL
jgi:hypothetical protein